MNFGKQEKPIFVRADQRGEFKELINSGKWESLISGNMKKGSIMGRHYHKYTNVYFHLLSGKVAIKTLDIKTGEKKTDSLEANQGYIFKPQEVRVIEYLEDGQFLMMKSHRYDPKEPDLIDYKEDF